MANILTQYYRSYKAYEDRLHRLTKEGAWIFIGQVASVLGALMLVRVLTEYLEPEEYGRLALGMTVAGLVNQVILGGINNGIIRYYSIAAEKGDLSGYLKASRNLMTWAIVAVGGVATTLMFGLIQTGQSHWLGLGAAILLFSVLSGLNASLNGIQNAARQRAMVAMHSAMDAWLKVGLAFGVMLWLGTNSTSVVIGYVCSAFLVTTSQLFFLNCLLSRNKVNSNSSSNQDWARKIWMFSWPFYATNIFGWIQQSSGRWSLETFTSTFDVGLFAALTQIGLTPVQVALSLIVSLLTPIIYNRAGDAGSASRNADVKSLTGKIAKIGILITICAFLLALAFQHFIFRIFVGNEYQAASRFLPWMVLAGGVFGVAQIFAMRLQSLMVMHRLVASGIAISLYGALLSVVGAIYMGLAGVVAGGVIFSFSYLALMFWWAYVRY